MPNLMIQLEQSFEPFVERFDRLAAAGIQAFSATAFEVLPALKSPLMLFVARCREIPPGNACCRDDSRDKEIVGPCGGLLRRTRSARRGRCCRSRCRPSTWSVFSGRSSIFSSKVRNSFALAVSAEANSGKTVLSARGGHHHLKTVALHPAVVLRITPSAFLIHPVKPLGDASGLTIAFVPQRAVGRHQTLIHGNNLRIGHAFRNGLFALQLDRRAEQLVCPPVAAEKRAPRGKIVPSGSLGNQSTGSVCR